MEFITQEDCLPLDDDIRGKYCVVAAETLAIEHRTPRMQIWLAKDGFGCLSRLSGKAVFAENLNGDSSRWERYDFIGMAKPETLAALGVKVPEPVHEKYPAGTPDGDVRGFDPK